MYLKYAQDLFLGKIELTRLKESLDDNGFRAFLKDNSLKFGLVKNTLDDNWSNGLTEQGTNVGTIKHSEIKAIDANGNLIYKPATDLISVPNDNTWYWVQITQAYSTLETGVVSIDISGNLVGDGSCEFLKIFRGQPNFPTKIKFSNATYNILEYEVLSVIDDNNAILQGVFTSETDLNFSVIGTFTPGVVINTVDKYPFQYDSCTFSLTSSSSVTPPVYSDFIFYLARVKRNGTNLYIEDKRNYNIYKTRTEYQLSNINITNGAGLIGIEAIKYDNYISTKEHNVVYISWNFRSSNWTIDTNSNKVTLNVGEGGTYKSIADFTDGDFDNWRIYVSNGNYYKIKASSKSGSAINLVLDTLNYKDFTDDLTQELLITPDTEEIQIRFKAAQPIFPATVYDITETCDKIYTFKINERIGKCWVPVYQTNNNTGYIVDYRYKTINNYTIFTLLPTTDSTHGYYTEDQFDDWGVVVASPTRTAYTNDAVYAYIFLKTNINHYYNVIQNLVTGDAFGIEERTLSNASPIVNLQIGTAKQYQKLIGDGIVLGANLFINLSKIAGKNGNNFYLHFTPSDLSDSLGDPIPTIDLNSKQLMIVTDYVNPTNYVLVKELTQNDIDFIDNSDAGLFMKFTYDGSDWVYASMNEVDEEETPVTISNSDITLWQNTAGTIATTSSLSSVTGGYTTKRRQKEVLIDFDMRLSITSTSSAPPAGQIAAIELSLPYLFKRVQYGTYNLSNTAPTYYPSGAMPMLVEQNGGRLVFNCATLNGATGLNLTGGNAAFNYTYHGNPPKAYLDTEFNGGGNFGNGGLVIRLFGQMVLQII